MLKRQPRFFILIFLFLLSVFAFSADADAVTYMLRNPYCYVYTTTNSAVAVVVDTYDNNFYYAYVPTRLQSYYSDEYYSGYFTIVQSSNDVHSAPARSASKTLMSGLVPGTAYTLSYNGYTTFYCGSSSNPIGPITIITEPTVPTNPTFSNALQTSVTVNWTKNGSGPETRYKVYRAVTESGPWILVYDGNGTYVVDSGLQPSTTYYYKVASYVAGSGEYESAVMSVTTGEDPAVAAATAAKVSADQAICHRAAQYIDF